MSSRPVCAVLAGLVACLAIGCNEGKPVPGVKPGGGPKWDADAAERRLAEFSKSLDAQAARIAKAEDKTLPHEKRLEVAEAALDEDDRIAERLDAVTKDVESALQSEIDPARFDRYRVEARKELLRYGELVERLGKVVGQFPADREKANDGK
jgi:hypothetical protein